VTLFLLVAVVLIVIAVGMIKSRRVKAHRQRAAETARLRALRNKPAVPFVSASLRGHTTQEQPKAR